MRGLFVDTSAWYSLANAAHRDHEALARELRRQIRSGTRVVATNLVVAETNALLLRRAGRRVAFAFLESVRQSPNRVATITPERTAAAIGDWIEPFSDQPFSLADAASFVVMTELGIRDALTLDHHFAVAGFAMLPHSR